jgi:hypothetical protein
VAQYTPLQLTTIGQNALAKAQTGTALQFTKVKFGDGTATEISSLTDLVRPVMTVPLESTAIVNATVKISCVLSNDSLASGFYLKEIGIFASQNGQEFLYAYTKATNADYIPPASSGPITQQFNFQFAVQAGANITFEVPNDAVVLQTEKGQAGGVATLDENGKVPSSQLNITKDQVGLGNVDNVKQATKTEFDAHAIDNTKHITAAERNSWNNKLDASEVVTTPTANKVLKLDANGKLPASITGNADGNAATATKLQTARTISLTGDVSGSTSFDGSANASIAVTLANSGVTPGTYPKVTVDAKGRVTGGQGLSPSDVPNLDWSKITSGKPTTAAGYGITDVYTKAEVDNKIDPINQALSQQNKQSATIGHGLSIVNASQNSPLDVQIEGRTLVNVSQNVLDAMKYYVLSDKKSKVKFADGTTYSGVAKFQGKNEKPILIRVEDFQNKVPGSTVENPHTAKSNHGKTDTSLQNPSSTSFFEPSQAMYNDRLSKQDGAVWDSSVTGNGYIAQQLFSFNLIEAIERNVGKIPGNTTADKVTWLKNNIAKLTFNWWGRGESPNGYKASLVIWKANTSSWHTAGAVFHNNGSITKISASSSPSYSDNTPNNNIDSNGFIHFLAYAEASNGVTASTIFTDRVELEIELNQNAQLWNPRFPLYEVDATEYANILTTWDENEVMRRYPMVESVQHIQNPFIVAEGENLLPSFTEWNLHANAVVREPYKLELNAIGTFQGSSYNMRALPNQIYTLSVSGNFNRVFIQEFDSNGTKIREQYLSSPGNFTFTTLSNTVSITIVMSNATTGTFTFEKPMLTLGSQPKPFVPRNPSYLFAEVKLGALFDKKDILFKDGQDWKVTKWIEKDVVLDGKLAWASGNDYAGFKRTFVNISANGAIQDSNKTVKYDGTVLETKDTAQGYGRSTISNAGTIYISVPDTETGFGENYIPTSDEWKAYFNGWQAKTVDANGKPTAWRSLVDGTDAPTQTLAYVKDNMAPGFTSYKVSYALTTPQTIVVTDKVEGDLVVNGATQIEVGSGVIIREKIVPVTSSESGYYHINNESIGTIPQNRLKNRLLALIGIYRNGIRDNKWITRTNYCYGNQRFEIAKADYDPTAEYTVTYLLLDRQPFTTNILSVIANYDSSLKSVVDSMLAKQSDIAANQSALIRSVAELYKRVKALGG